MKTMSIIKLAKLCSWRSIYVAVAVFVSIGVVMYYALARGQDFNWDQRNYHIAIPFLLSNHTFWTSIAPAGIQSYFNPYVLQVQYFAIEHLSPIGFTIAIAVLQSIPFMVAALICAGVARAPSKLAMNERDTALLSMFGFALCMMAPIVLSEAGTTFIDAVLAVPVLSAYALLLFRGRRIGIKSAALLAGVLLGAVTALKLTNGMFALGIVGFALAGRESLRERIVWLSLCGGATFAAFLVVGGAWHFALWERFGNPVFPFYNNIFRSVDFGSAVFRDERFLPRSVLDIWIRPIYWLRGGSPTPGIYSPSAELHFTDARWVMVVFGGSVFMAALALLPRLRARCIEEKSTGLFFSFTITYLIWLAQFGYHRYIAALDVICGAIILYLVIQIPFPTLRLWLLAAATVLTWKILDVPDWGHLSWRPYWQSINQKQLDLGGPSVVFLTEKPTSYIAASLPVDTRYVGLYGDIDLYANSKTNFSRQLKEMIDAFSGRLKVVYQDSNPVVAVSILASYGLIITTRCQQLHVADATFKICDAERRR